MSPSGRGPGASLPFRTSTAWGTAQAPGARPNKVAATFAPFAEYAIALSPPRGRGKPAQDNAGTQSNGDANEQFRGANYYSALVVALLTSREAKGTTKWPHRQPELKS